jgi:probable rRNA maturation factor
MPTLVRRSARGSPALDNRRIRGLGNRMLAALEMPDAELSVLLTDDAMIRRLNAQHRHEDRPTDVLAFALEEAEAGDARLLGDVVISLDTAARQAKGRRRPLLSEVRFLLAHGLLHLCGYDHDTAAGKREMDRLTRHLVRAAGGK